MFGNFGYAEVIIICFLALLLFGAKRLPEVGQSLGKSIRMFKKGIKDIQEEIPDKDELDREDYRARSRAQNPPPASNTNNYEAEKQVKTETEVKDQD